MTEWHTIKGYNRKLSKDANIENGVDLPENDRDVLVIYPDLAKKTAYVKRTTEVGMTGTDYYDGTMWAYYDMPVFEEPEEEVCRISAQGKMLFHFKKEIEDKLTALVERKHKKVVITHLASADFIKLMYVNVRDDDDVEDIVDDTEWEDSFDFKGYDIYVEGDAVFGRIELTLCIERDELER